MPLEKSERQAPFTRTSPSGGCQFGIGSGAVRVLFIVQVRCYHNDDGSWIDGESGWLWR